MRYLLLLAVLLALAAPARAEETPQFVEPYITLTATWTSPGHAVVAWSWAYPACLWRAASPQRPEQWLACKGQQLELGPGDYFKAVPLAGDVYELRDEGAGIVVRSVVLPPSPYAGTTAILPVVVR